MKNLKTVSILLLFVFAFTSCNKDDEMDEPTNEELIIGLWQLQSATQDGNPVTLQTCQLLSTIRFTEAGTFTETNYSGNNCSVATPTSGPYTINGNTITVTSGSDATIVQIKTLNESSLSVEFDISGVLVVNNYVKQ